MSNLPSPSGVRKRPYNPELWKQNAAKKARNLGQEYVSPFHGRMVAAKSVGQPCGCTLGCFDLVGVERINAINADYWKLGDHTLQTSFIQSHTKSAKPKKRYAAAEAMAKSCTRQYHLTVNGELVQVCKKAFARALGITLGRIDNAMNAQTPSGTVIPDGRGRHSNHPRIPEYSLQLAIDHINTFPTVFIHYARYVLKINVICTHTFSFNIVLYLLDYIFSFFKKGNYH